MTDTAPLGSSKTLDGVEYIRLIGQHSQRMATSLDRDDLAAALDVQLDRIDHPLVVALVVGPCDSGKTSFINAMLGSSALPVDLLAPTSWPVVVSYGKEPDAVLNVLTPGGDGQPGEPFRLPISPSEMAGYITGRRSPGEGNKIESVSVRLDRGLLERGLVLVDTPSLVGDTAASFVRTMLAQAGDNCDLVIYVVDAAQELTRTDLDFMTEVAQARVPLICVRTKFDIFTHWRRILQLDVGHLADAGLKVESFAASSTLRSEALARDDRTLNEASGYPQIARHLVNEAFPRSYERVVERTLQTSRATLSQLTSALRVQREVLADPTRSSDVTDRLRAIERRAEALRTGSSLWRDRLQAGIEELQLDFEHELRRRLSELQDRVLLMIEGGDPTSIWADLTADLQSTVTRTVVDSFVDLHRRANDLTTDVAQLFGDEEAAVLAASDIDNTRAAIAKFHLQDRLDTDSSEGGFSLGILAVRGSAGGLSVAALLSRFAVLSPTAVLFTPIVAVLALVMGKKALDSGRKSQVQARRRSAITACKRYFDSVMLEVGKRSRQELLSVRSDVRSYLEDRAQLLAKKIVADRTAAENAVRVQAEEVPAHLERIETTLRQIALIDAHATRALSQIQASGPGLRAAQAVAAQVRS